MAESLYKKSILFELLDRTTGRVKEAFTLTIPPESFNVEEPQRVSKKKTFGGIFIDDYGPDNQVISISGNTGGMTARNTYSTSKGASINNEKFDGRKAFYYFRDKIIRYKKWLKDDYLKYDLRLYDLSTANERAMVAGVPLEIATEGYVCQLDKFKSSRNKDKPLFFSYDLELTAIRELGTATYEVKNPVAIKDPFTVLGAIRKAVNVIKRTLTSIKNVMDKIDNLIDLVDDLEDQFISFVNQVNNLVNYPRTLIEKCKNLSREIVQDIRNLTEQEKAFFSDQMDYYKILITSTSVNTLFCSLVVNGKTMGSAGYKRYTEKSGQSNVDDLILRTEDFSIEEDAPAIDEFMDKDINESSEYVTYGYKTVTITETTTLENLAANYLGDPIYQSLLADFNGLAGDDDLVVGQTVKIPSLVKGESVFSNLVYSTELVDVYGSDIRLDADGNMVISANGDYAIVSGIKNIIQAVNLRLNETLGRRLRLIMYGLRTSVGGNMSDLTPLSYAVVNIKDTLIQDPRISRIEGITMNMSGDAIEISLNFTTIKEGDYIPYSGEI
jgi:hypothetical protein